MYSSPMGNCKPIREYGTVLHMLCIRPLWGIVRRLLFSAALMGCSYSSPMGNCKVFSRVGVKQY